jgi:flavodoxin
MKALVVYDSKWGNTEAIAKAIAAGINKDARVAKVGEPAASDVEGLALLVVGSPVLGGKPSKPMQEYLKTIVQSSTTKMRIATFDTRMKMKFAEKFGFAADRMADQLKEQGNIILSVPMGFIVNGQKGPLAEGEVERAEKWGRELAKSK